MAGYGIRGGHRVLLRTEDGDFVRMFFALWEAKGEEKTHLFVSWCTIQAIDVTSSEKSDNGSEVDAGYPDMGDSLVDNWRSVAEAQPAAMFSREVASVVSAVESLSLYAVVERDFTLLPYAFSFPLYDEDAARAISYAGLGSQVQHRRAEERIRGLCMWGKKEAVNGELIVTCDSKGDVVYKLRSI
ncbi:hypothetical protein V5799_025008 [Amblyomma americanum]|uniref:Uncharacterized protein n=1 Tax=Amblyomma americanum TaxID=6943 RepID=A0AAQ4EAW3_AMBAM